MASLTLVIMAAGLGSRFKGDIKQIAKVGSCGELIMDYSIYDAKQAGFDKVVFVINQSIEKEFRERIFNRISKNINAEYVFQGINDLPEKFKNMPPLRIKPWGTAHAVLSARHVVDTPFCVINADDFYGREAFAKVAAFLKQQNNSGKDFTMVGYKVGSTLQNNREVSRAICKTNENKMLTGITDNSVEKIGDLIYDTKSWQAVDYNQRVSMNIWGLTPEIFQILENQFEDFLNNIKVNGLAAEFSMPVVMNELVQDGTITIKMQETSSKCIGFTYSEEVEQVNLEINEMTKNGIYPSPLWREQNNNAVNKLLNEENEK